MHTTARHWSFLLLLGSGLVVFGEPSQRVPKMTERARAAVETAETRAAKARSDRVAEHLRCVSEREDVLADIRARRTRCDSELEQYEACRAARPPLGGSDLLGCGLGLAVGLAAGGLAQPWSLGECGVAGPPESRADCPHPGCEHDPKAIEREVLTARGLHTLPRCEEPAV